MPSGSREVGHVADAAVDRVGEERDAARLELGAGGLDVLDLQRERDAVGLERDAQALRRDQGDGDGAGLELGADRLVPGRCQTLERSRPSTSP